MDVSAALVLAIRDAYTRLADSCKPARSHFVDFVHFV
jgi:hypothetical protein